MKTEFREALEIYNDTSKGCQCEPCQTIRRALLIADKVANESGPRIVKYTHLTEVITAGTWTRALRNLITEASK